MKLSQIIFEREFGKIKRFLKSNLLKKFVLKYETGWKKRDIKKDKKRQ